jgi:Ankyrin repeat
MTASDVTFEPLTDVKNVRNLLRQGRAKDAADIFDAYSAEWRTDEMKELLRTLKCEMSLICDAAIVPGGAVLIRWLVQQGLKVDCRCPAEYPSDHVLAYCMNAHASYGTSTKAEFEALLSCGADANGIAVGGGTLPLLHYAVMVGRLDFAELLLRYGADIGLKNEMGMDAIEYAVKYKKHDAQKLFLSWTNRKFVDP